MQTIQLRTIDPEDRLDLLTKLYEASLKGVPIYIRYLNENLDRAGAIARIKVEKVTRRDRRKSIDYYGRERYDPNDTRVEYIWGRATWDKRSNTVEWSSANQDYEFLIGYVGPTEWYYKSKKDRVPKEAIPAYDRLGRKIQEGDFVTYILNTGVPLH